MYLEAEAAKTLAAIIIVSTFGQPRLDAQRPLEVVDRQDAWLVKGTPYTWEHEPFGLNQTYFFFRKRDAEVIGMGNEGRMKLSPNERAYWLHHMSKADFDRIFGPLKTFEVEPQGTARQLTLSKVLYGGLVNTPAEAVAYAHVLMTSSNTTLAAIPEADLSAEDKNDIWHIRATRNVAGFARGAEILTFSRTNGKLLSGGL